jgi:hypothetical protein
MGAGKMNERIEELYKQSFIEVQDENSFPCMTFSKQKFAELIVRECIDIALTTKAEQLELVSDTAAFDSMPEGAKDHSFGRVVAVNQVVANIKEHFGVEE